MCANQSFYLYSVQTLCSRISEENWLIWKQSTNYFVFETEMDAKMDVQMKCNSVKDKIHEKMLQDVPEREKNWPQNPSFLHHLICKLILYSNATFLKMLITLFSHWKKSFKLDMKLTELMAVTRSIRSYCSIWTVCFVFVHGIDVFLAQFDGSRKVFSKFNATETGLKLNKRTLVHLELNMKNVRTTWE